MKMDQQKKACPKYADQESCVCDYCKARFLLDLSERLRNVPIMFGVDDGDISGLREIAALMSFEALQDDLHAEG